MHDSNDEDGGSFKHDSDDDSDGSDETQRHHVGDDLAFFDAVVHHLAANLTKMLTITQMFIFNRFSDFNKSSSFLLDSYETLVDWTFIRSRCDV